MTAVDPLQRRYDETPYHDQAFAEFDVSRLRGMAQLFGLIPTGAPTRALRVLDLACASGVHVREQAARYPSVQFTGVDFSANEIELGQKAISEQGLANVELIHWDLRAFEPDEGAFDLVLCHGAFSWVPDDVKDRILQLGRLGLAPGGLAAIAYLTYPGWKQKEALRELLSMRVERIADPAERIRQSALVLRFLHAGYSAGGENVHARSFKAVVESMQRSSQNVFLHDDLGEIHDPCYFMQFAEWAEECGLRYLAEADLGSMSAGGLPAEAGGLLQLLDPNFLETQQLLDFVVNRSGRSSLLVRSDAICDRGLGQDTLMGLDLTTRWWDVTPLNGPANSGRSFDTQDGRRRTLGDPALERMFTRIAAAPEKIMPVADLYAEEREHGHADEATTAVLRQLLGSGAAEPRARVDLAVWSVEGADSSG